MEDVVRHAISVLVENKFGVLARISTLFAARGFNIDSLAVGETEDPAISRMTIVVKSDDCILEQVTKQLNKLIDVIKVNEFNDNIEYVERGACLVKISLNKSNRNEVMQMVEIFRSKIVDISQSSVIVEVTGSEDKISAFVRKVMPCGIKEMCRTGIVALGRGQSIIKVSSGR
ncbi:MAG: acetolactate synthase small subunit [Endomicrobium sp.]|jgi:acetolactate synthase-1/3 small subunit|nr:acetolactate synthase small subunit [Endomicrobium sp.]